MTAEIDKPVKPSASPAVAGGRLSVSSAAEILAVIALIVPSAGAAIRVGRYMVAGLPQPTKLAVLAGLPELALEGLLASYPVLLILPFALHLRYQSVVSQRLQAAKNVAAGMETELDAQAEAVKKWEEELETGRVPWRGGDSGCDSR